LFVGRRQEALFFFFFFVTFDLPPQAQKINLGGVSCSRIMSKFMYRAAGLCGRNQVLKTICLMECSLERT
jgi:hypothetical protein